MVKMKIVLKPHIAFALLVFTGLLCRAQDNDKILNRQYADQKKIHFGFSVGTNFQDIGIVNREATACADVTGYKDKVTKIVMYMYIQQLNNGSWKTLDSHRYEFDSWHAAKEIYYSPCPHGYTYRLKTSYYVYSGTDYEYISGYSPNFVYN